MDYCCRLCDCTKSERFINVFALNANGVQIVQGIRKYLNIIIYRYDPLSKYICSKCNERLDIVQNFQQNVLQTDAEHHKQLLTRQRLNDREILYMNVINNCNEKQEEEKVRYLSNKCIETEDVQQEEEEEDNLLGELDNADSLNSILDHAATNGYGTGSTSDMELCDADETLNNVISEQKRKIPFEDYGPPIIKKQKLSSTFKITYNPFSLLKMTIHAINKQNLDNFSEDHFTKLMEHVEEEEEEEDEDEVVECIYCNQQFATLNELAVHELKTHIRLNLEKVDCEQMWKEVNEESIVRNKWMCDNNAPPPLPPPPPSKTATPPTVQVDENIENDLLVPLDNPPQEQPDVVVAENEITFVEDVATLNGVPLQKISKQVRNSLYQTVSMNGVKRKYCKYCRYTYKDNWAMEYHYLSKACYYSCRYCGLRFNKNKSGYGLHVAEHEELKHKPDGFVYVGSRLTLVPKRLNANILKPYVPPPPPIANPQPTFQQQNKPQQQQQHKIKIKTLFAKKKVNPPPPATSSSSSSSSVAAALLSKLPPIRPKTSPHLRQQYASNLKRLQTSADLKLNTQAYFCKKCFQVFAHLDEFNQHNKMCTGEIDDPEMKVIRPYKTRKNNMVKQEVYTNATSPNIAQQQQRSGNKMVVVQPKLEHTQQKEEFLYSSSGRPLRNCVKEVSYNDETEMLSLNDEGSGGRDMKGSLGDSSNYDCQYCDATFRSFQSKNSHMRIHKNVQSIKTASPTTTTTTITIPQQINNKRIKQETLEPIVEIHEGPSTKVPTSIGSVSITPVKKTTTVSPALIKLVQNNPNITIKAPVGDLVGREGGGHTSRSSSPSSSDADRTYRCSSCSQTFANKSNLYFHKKNQCGGSKYPCPFCKKRFGTEAAYSSHIYYSHPE